MAAARRSGVQKSTASAASSLETWMPTVAEEASSVTEAGAAGRSAAVADDAAPRSAAPRQTAETAARRRRAGGAVRWGMGILSVRVGAVRGAHGVGARLVRHGVRERRRRTARPPDHTEIAAVSS